MDNESNTIDELIKEASLVIDEYSRTILIGSKGEAFDDSLVQEAVQLIGKITNHQKKDASIDLNSIPIKRLKGLVAIMKFYLDNSPDGGSLFRNFDYQ